MGNIGFFFRGLRPLKSRKVQLIKFFLLKKRNHCWEKAPAAILVSSTRKKRGVFFGPNLIFSGWELVNFTVNGLELVKRDSSRVSDSFFYRAGSCRPELIRFAANFRWDRVHLETAQVCKAAHWCVIWILNCPHSFIFWKSHLLSS